MPSVAAEMFNNLPGWARPILTVIAALGVFFVTWKGILPHFVAQVEEGNRGLLYRRNKPRADKDGHWKIRGPGHHPVFPGIWKIRQTNVLVQRTTINPIRVDLRNSSMTYEFSGSVWWRVVNIHDFQLYTADTEQAIADIAARACREALLSLDDPQVNSYTLTRECEWRVAKDFGRMGVELVEINISELSLSTHNHRIIEESNLSTASNIAARIVAIDEAA